MWVGNLMVLGQILSDLLFSAWCLVSNKNSTKITLSHKPFHPQMGRKANQILSVASRKAAVIKGTVHLVHICPPLASVLNVFERSVLRWGFERWVLTHIQAPLPYCFVFALLCEVRCITEWRKLASVSKVKI